MSPQGKIVCLATVSLELRLILQLTLFYMVSRTVNALSKRFPSFKIWLGEYLHECHKFDDYINGQSAMAIERSR